MKDHEAILKHALHMSGETGRNVEISRTTAIELLEAMKGNFTPNANGEALKEHQIKLIAMVKAAANELIRLSHEIEDLNLSDGERLRRRVLPPATHADWQPIHESDRWAESGRRSVTVASMELIRAIARPVGA
jgi:hypothetical protein